MNKKLDAPKPVNFEAAIDSFFAHANACALVFRTQNLQELKVGIDAFIKTLFQVIEVAPSSILMLINVRDSKQSYLANLIIKTSLITYLLSNDSKYSAETVKRLISAALLLIFSMSPYFLAIKRESRLLRKYKNTLKSAGRICFRQIKELYINEPDVLRVISQIANINEFRSKNQISQSIVLVSVNTSIYTCPFHHSKPMSADAALAKASTLQNIVNPKPFTNSYAYAFASTISKLSYGKVCVNADNSFGIYLGFKERKINISADVPCLPYENIDGARVFNSPNITGSNKIRYVLPQQAMDFSLATKHLSAEVIEGFIGLEGLTLNKTKRYSPPEYLADTSKALLSETTHMIASYLSEDIRKSKLVMEYAEGVTRTHQPISNIRHAIALLGMVRIFPVVCISEMKLLQNKNIAFGEYEVINKENIFATISYQISRLCNFSVPEYQELISRVLFQSLMTVPKSRYAASIATILGPNDLASNSLNEVLGKAKLSDWSICTKRLTQEWKLPKLYQSTLSSFFDVKSGLCDISNLPKQLKLNVCGLLVAEWVLINWLKGYQKPSSVHIISTALNALCISNSDFLNLYQKLIDKASPHSSLL